MYMRSRAAMHLVHDITGRSEREPDLDLRAAMEEYLRALEGRQLTRPPGVALATGSSREFFIPELHLVFTATAYVFIGKYIEKLPAPPQQLLDLGCGTGYGTSYLKKNFASPTSVIAIDCVPALVKYGAKNYSQPGLTFMPANSCLLPFRKETFDTVIAIFSIIHNMTQSQARDCLAEIARVLKSDGILIFTTPNRELFQDLYHENPDDDPRLKLSSLDCHQYYMEELKSFLLSLADEKENFFATVSVNSLTNTPFQPVWRETLSKMKRRRFKPSGRESVLSALVRRFMPVGLKARYFYGMVHKVRRKLSISLYDIARGAEYYPEEGGIRADQFLVIARKGNKIQDAGCKIQDAS